MLFFSYGSNMDFAQMRDRCPSARFIAVAKFPDHRLAFTRYAKDRGCGVCDALPEPGKDIWGVLYDVADGDFERLDRSEGYQPGRPLDQNAYWREQRRVYREGKETEPILAWLYLANRQPNPPPPNTAYKRQLVEGAKHWGLPDEYVAQLERITVT